jgi:hypothetical protein
MINLHALTTNLIRRKNETQQDGFTLTHFYRNR